MTLKCGRRSLRQLAAALLAMAWSTIAVADSQYGFVANFDVPINVGDTILSATAYHDSGAYERDVEKVARQAADWIAERAPAVKRPALVLDVDETALSNWEVIKRDNFGRPIGGVCTAKTEGPCGWAAWDQLGGDPAIAPTLDVFRKARALKVAVFFITGRPDDQREATERNLKAAGYDGYEKLFTAPPGVKFTTAADFKAPIRAQIEREGFTIIANIGDQPSDLYGGSSERAYLLPIRSTG